MNPANTELVDILIQNGTIIDGTGNPWYFADVAVRDGKICGMGQLQVTAKHTIDASRLVVCPGFVDAHSHSVLMLLA